MLLYLEQYKEKEEKYTLTVYSFMYLRLSTALPLIPGPNSEFKKDVWSLDN